MRSKFSVGGREYREAELPDGHGFFFAQVEDDEGDIFDGELSILRKDRLYDSPPKAKAHNELAALQTECEAAKQTLCDSRAELAAFESEASSRLTAIKRHKPLARLEDFLAGRITHYVLSQHWSPPEILLFEDATTDDASHGCDRLKLLTLFGRTDGDLEWGLNRWSDGSGNNHTVTPCLSRDEAVAAAKGVFAAHETEALDPGDHRTPGRDWVARADEYGIAMSDEYMRALEKQEADTKQAEIDKINKRLGELIGPRPVDADAASSQ